MFRDRPRIDADQMEIMEDPAASLWAARKRLELCRVQLRAVAQTFRQMGCDTLARECEEMLE